MSGKGVFFMAPRAKKEITACKNGYLYFFAFFGYQPLALGFW